ncbi:MAG: ABC transporter substrate-binding protein [Actinomycetales bacterium]|nr:ABC transporter substrate-binding protein [Actinomycetales bacterium]
MRRTRLMASIAALGAASVVLAACGGGTDTAVEETTAAEAPAEEAPAATDNCPLIIGTLLPQTGSLAFLGPPEFAGVDLAVGEINGAGGVLGQEVQHLVGDSGDTTTDIASQTVDSHLAAGAQAIVGAASSGVSLTVIDKITSAGVVHFSPANTSPELTTYDDGGLYFRTAPPDTFQGAVMAQLVANDGHTKLAVLNLDDSYGNGLATVTKDAFTAAGGEVVAAITYDPNAAEFAAEVTQVKAAAPNAVVLIGFDETTKILQEMIKQGVGPDAVPVYLVDGNLSGSAYAELPADIMVGVKGTLPGAAATTELQDRLKGVNADLTDFSYAAESYDAVNLIALAAQLGGSCDGQTIADNLLAVSGTDGGDACSDFASCKALLDGGATAIDYEGQSGPVNFNQYGDPGVATMGVYAYTANDKYEPLLEEFITADVPQP